MLLQMLRPMNFDDADNDRNRSNGSPGSSMLSALTMDDDEKPMNLLSHGTAHARIFPAKVNTQYDDDAVYF